MGQDDVIAFLQGAANNSTCLLACLRWELLLLTRAGDAGCRQLKPKCEKFWTLTGLVQTYAIRLEALIQRIATGLPELINLSSCDPRCQRSAICSRESPTRNG